ncbi:MAG: thioesterase [Methanosphaera sp. rholeuAM6]|nr:MAG: thioesterase [Methanosphaera sp. rholeuAM6]
MFKSIIDVSSRDTDSLGHVNNTSLPLWFETSRNELYRIFNPSMELKPETWNLIMVHTEFDYLDQIYYGYEVEIRTYIEEIGNTSFTVYQEAWQKGKLRGTGRAILVDFNFNNQKKVPIPEDIRKELEKHLYRKQEVL